MDKKDLLDCSPIRAFDNATNGGLKAGEIGLITSAKGMGKSAVLVQFGLDALLAGKQLVHVSFDAQGSSVNYWYSTVFAEIAKKKNISNEAELKADVMRNRTTLKFNPENFTLQKLVNTISAMKGAGFEVSSLVIDDTFAKEATAADMKAVLDFAKSENLVIWMTSTCDSDKLNDCASADVLASLSAVLHLESTGNGVALKVLKLREATPETSLKLDSKTFLISNK
ncbi:MAG: hypothetical protein MJ169_06405 [Treponema sp.]|nr:hypothetical protein [Treponema sp.]